MQGKRTGNRDGKVVRKFERAIHKPTRELVAVSRRIIRPGNHATMHDALPINTRPTIALERHNVGVRLPLRKQDNIFVQLNPVPRRICVPRTIRLGAPPHKRATHTRERTIWHFTRVSRLCPHDLKRLGLIVTIVSIECKGENRLFALGIAHCFGANVCAVLGRNGLLAHARHSARIPRVGQSDGLRPSAVVVFARVRRLLAGCISSTQRI